jgi:hypothetical protein
MELVDEVERLRDALDAANERIANFERHVEREIEPKLLARAETAKAERDRLAGAGKELVAVLESTLYQPPGFTGPPVWWNNKARAALDAWTAALAAGTEGDQ